MMVMVVLVVAAAAAVAVIADTNDRDGGRENIFSVPLVQCCW